MSERRACWAVGVGRPPKTTPTHAKIRPWDKAATSNCGGTASFITLLINQNPSPSESDPVQQ